MNDLLFYIISALGWTLPRFFYKELTQYLSSIDIIIIIHLAFHIMIVSFIFYIWIFKKKTKTAFISKIRHLPQKLKYYIFLIVIFGITAQFAHISLLKYYDVSKVTPIVRGISTLFILFFGYFIFKETITLKKIVGILTILLGIYLVN